jgi:hypothetical protein
MRQLGTGVEEGPVVCAAEECGLIRCTHKSRLSGNRWLTVRITPEGGRINVSYASYRTGIVVRVHRPAPMIVVAMPSFIVELAYVR